MKYSAFNTFYRSLTQTHQMFARVCLGDTIKKSDKIGKSDQCNNVPKCLSICRLEPLKRAGKIPRYNKSCDCYCADVGTIYSYGNVEKYPFEEKPEDIYYLFILYTENASYPLHVQRKPYVRRCRYFKTTQ